MLYLALREKCLPLSSKLGSCYRSGKQLHQASFKGMHSTKGLLRWATRDLDDAYLGKQFSEILHHGRELSENILHAPVNPNDVKPATQKICLQKSTGTAAPHSSSAKQ